VLGVIVGKRLESRGRAMAPVVEDPLAALDRFSDHAGATGEVTTAQAPALTFPKALLGSGTTGKFERTERAASKTTLATTAPAAALPVAPPTAAPAANKKLAALPRPVMAAPVTNPAASEGAASSKTTAPVAATKPVPTKLALKAAPTSAATTPGKASVAAPSAKSPSPLAPAIASAPASRADKPKAGFALQLSSFQDRNEADAFARRFAAQNAHVVVSEIPGKGTWYRVRVGSYGTMKDATAAKTSFERDHNVIAYVAGSGPAQ
jgi:septal ring-binding cell division protein DamX